MYQISYLEMIRLLIINQKLEKLKKYELKLL
jgi:hypothetical protein